MALWETKKARRLARTAAEAKRYKLQVRGIRLAFSALVVLVLLAYIISLLYSQFGSFTVTVNKFDANRFHLTLSETPDFSHQTVRLNARAAEDVTNISGDTIPADVDMQNGVHNGDNYIAYTFFLKNVGQEKLNYSYEVYIVNVEANVDKAIRIRVYVNGIPTTYARTRTDGLGPEPGTVEFRSPRSIVLEEIHDFETGDVTKFTVVIWLEGPDPDCVDDLMGGSIKVDMNVNVLN